MKYLSIDIESTGLEEDAKIIEFGCVPIDASLRTIANELKFSTKIKCPSFEELEPTLNEWVKKNNEKLIRSAHKEGIPMEEFKSKLESYIKSDKVQEFFDGQKIILFGKSLSAIDLPFLSRDLGHEYMRTLFHHRNLDLSSVGLSLKDAGLLPDNVDGGSSSLMKYLKMGTVQHTALEDAENTAIMYFKLLDEVVNKTKK